MKGPIQLSVERSERSERSENEPDEPDEPDSRTLPPTTRVYILCIRARTLVVFMLCIVQYVYVHK